MQGAYALVRSVSSTSNLLESHHYRDSKVWFCHMSSGWFDCTASLDMDASYILLPLVLHDTDDFLPVKNKTLCTGYCVRDDRDRDSIRSSPITDISGLTHSVNEKH